MEYPKDLRYLIALLLAIFVRSCVFVFFEGSHFDSDQALWGIIAHRISQGIDFPIFPYGQTYLFGLESWLAAPFMWAFGASVTTLKLPLLLVNLAIGVILYRLLTQDAKLCPAFAFVVSSFFWMASPVAASRWTCMGGYSLSLLGVLLLWLWRDKPMRLGVVLGLLIPVRPFVLYGVAGLVMTFAWRRPRAEIVLRIGRVWRPTVLAGVVAIAMIIGLQWLGSWNENTFHAKPPSLTLATPRGFFHATKFLLREHVPSLLGIRPDALISFNIRSAITSGSWIWGAVALAIALALAVQARRSSRKPMEPLAAYLIWTGLISALAHPLLSPVQGDVNLIRYVMLAILIPIGLSAAYLRSESRVSRRTWAVAAISCIALSNAWSHARLAEEYLFRQPQNPYRKLADALIERGFSSGEAPFWTSYHVSFITGERVRLLNFPDCRIHDYWRTLELDPSRAALISEGSCPPGTRELESLDNYRICSHPDGWPHIPHSCMISKK